MDTKNLGRIVRPSHRVTGDRRDSVDGAGWEFAHVAIHETQIARVQPTRVFMRPRFVEHRFGGPLFALRPGAPRSEDRSAR